MKYQPVQDGLAAIDGSAKHRMVELNAYGLLMSKWDLAQPVSFNGHPTRAVDFESFARHTVQFFYSARCFIDKLSFGGPLYFRLKMNNTRSLRTFFNEKNATVLEDYVRLDDNYTVSHFTASMPRILQDVLQTAAWSLGLQITDTEMQTLLHKLCKDISYEK